MPKPRWSFAASPVGLVDLAIGASWIVRVLLPLFEPWVVIDFMALRDRPFGASG
jgi:hypothetical protein